MAQLEHLQQRSSRQAGSLRKILLLATRTISTAQPTKRLGHDLTESNRLEWM